MRYTKEELLQQRVFFHFHQICQIPHGSGNEKALSDYVRDWARDLGLDAYQDDADNVLIRKPATPGYQQSPVVMLQAHMDMVCEKAEDIQHDFTADPIEWVIDGDMLSTGGRTTLGADDGIGMALAMAILEAEDLNHPALEVLLTTMEEEDLSGASRFDKSQMKASYLFNLDHVNDQEILCGSCGGMQADIHIPVRPEPIPETYISCRLSVSGLKGGHSGEDIHRGRGNANILLARMLMALEGCCQFRLNQIRGGSFRLAIPRSAEALVWLDPGQLDLAQKVLWEIENQVRSELASTGHRVKVRLEPAEAESWGVDPKNVISAMVLVPDGIFQMNEMLTGLVDTSDNLGEVYLDERELHFVIEIRSARDSLRTYLFQRMERLADTFGGTCSWSNAYPSWDFRPDSPLLRLCGEVYERTYNEKPIFLTAHAGLEVGCLFGEKSDLDAVSIGPECSDFHSPSESVRIPSVNKVYEFLCNILAEIR